eukprot:COSAG05_NODE_2701_length_2749_cov_1433.536166_3_plen_82_part_01
MSLSVSSPQGKTIGKQIAFTIKPFVFKWIASIQANKLTQSIVKQAAKGITVLPAAMQDAVHDVTRAAGGRADAVQQLNNLKK